MDLRNCQFKNSAKEIAKLAHCITLQLRDCASFDAVGLLSHLSVLCLIGCSNLVDVKALGHIRSVDLSKCVKVHDVSFLRDVASTFCQTGASVMLPVCIQLQHHRVSVCIQLQHHRVSSIWKWSSWFHKFV